MEDYFQIIVFLIFVAFSVISRLLSPKKKKPPTRNPEEYRQPGYDEVPGPEKPVVDWEKPAKKKPASFEDVLREMMGESKPQEVPRPQKVREEVKQAKTQAKQKVQQIKQTAKKAKLIADKISLEDTGKRITTIEVAKKKNTVAQEVSEALNNPKSAREAIILSEIINRKYF